MWREDVLPRLRERGVGLDRASVTLRLSGIGESALADLVGEDRLRRANPQMATYARSDAVDLRISAVGDGGTRAADLVAQAEAAVAPLLAGYTFARGDETWIDALARRLAGRRVAVVEIGTAGQLAALLGAADWFVLRGDAGAGSRRSPWRMRVSSPTHHACAPWPGPRSASPYGPESGGGTRA